jgi:hypothetical protein
MLFPELSLSRIVITEVDEPLAVKDVDAAVTVDVDADGIPGLSVMTGCVERFIVLAVTVIVSVPGEVPEV